MTVGLAFYNDTGSLLLGLGFKNPVVRAAGTVATGASGHPAGKLATITYTNSSASSHPILFIVGDCDWFILNAFKSGSTWTWNVLARSPIASVDYMIFDEPTNTYGHVGLELYADAAGSPLLFGMDTSLKPLRVAANTNVGATLPASRTYATAVGGRAGDRVWENGAQNGSGVPDATFYALISYGASVQLSGNSLTFNSGASGIRLDPATAALSGTASPDYSQERSYGPRSALVADVTGF